MHSYAKAMPKNKPMSSDIVKWKIRTACLSEPWLVTKWNETCKNNDTSRNRISSLLEKSAFNWHTGSSANSLPHLYQEQYSGVFCKFLLHCASMKKRFEPKFSDLRILNIGIKIAHDVDIESTDLLNWKDSCKVMLKRHIFSCTHTLLLGMPTY